LILIDLRNNKKDFQRKKLKPQLTAEEPAGPLKSFLSVSSSSLFSSFFHSFILSFFSFFLTFESLKLFALRKFSLRSKVRPAAAAQTTV
jgi:hypothetical protein